MTNKYTLVLDSSQISTFLECPQLWNLQYHRRLVPTFFQQDTTAMDAGTYGHKMLDIFYKARACGVNFNDAAGLAFTYNPDLDTCECGCNVYDHREIEALTIAPCHHCAKCANFKPKPFRLESSVRLVVQNRLREYFAKYQLNDYLPLSDKHVEVGFSEPIYEDEENLFVLEGRVDLIGTLQGLNAVIDHKFQMQEHYLYKKSVQFKNYALISKTCMLIINYIRLHKGLKDTTMVRELVSFSVPELLAWKQKLIGIFFKIKSVNLSGIYEQNWNSCKGFGKTFKPTEPKYCLYTQLCEEPNEDMVRVKENQLYKVNENPWRPW